MNIRLLFSITCLLLISCAKSQIKRNACAGDAGYLVLDSCSIFFNNIITPNADGINDNFPNYCGCPAAEEFSISVKDRNKVLFETTDPNDILWDGTYEGKEVKEGVYDFFFRAKIGAINSSFDGTITLIRDISKPIKVNNYSCVYNNTDPLIIK
ncbi:MAG: T9SS type B sorting domain-containing protein [Crocinitomix sp.]|nr:T9SS type B sorting domain-containing protein [Crocinitomix sp.]